MWRDALEEERTRLGLLLPDQKKSITKFIKRRQEKMNEKNIIESADGTARIKMSSIGHAEMKEFVEKYEPR